MLIRKKRPWIFKRRLRLFKRRLRIFRGKALHTRRTQAGDGKNLFQIGWLLAETHSIAEDG